MKFCNCVSLSCGVVIVCRLFVSIFHSVPSCFVAGVSITVCLEMLCRCDGVLCHSGIWLKKYEKCVNTCAEKSTGSINEKKMDGC